MRRRGFTLIEVVVALAILGVGLIVIIELFSGGLRLGKVAEEYTKAVGYGRMKMEEIALSRGLAEGEEEGQFDNDYRWRVEIKKVDLLPVEKNPEFKAPVEFYSIKVNVLWKSGMRERTAEFDSYKTIKPDLEGKS